MPQSHQPDLIPFTYINTPQALAKEAVHWRNPEAEILAIDLECENNLHHYGVYISIIQISTRKHNWIVDVLQMDHPGHLAPLLEALRDPTVEKVFHDTGFDFRILQKELGCRPRNVFDSQIAAVLLGKKDIGLGSLLKEYMGLGKESAGQMFDWTIRPLTPIMLTYAVGDTAHLLRLRDILKDELEKKGRFSWAEEEFSLLEARKMESKEPSYLDVPKVSFLSDPQRAILKRLYDIREHLARKVNRPFYFILNNKQLLALSQKPPTRLEEWQTMKGVHPIVKARARQFFDAVAMARRERLPMPRRERVRGKPLPKPLMEKLESARNTVAERLDIPRHLVMSQEQMLDVARQRSFTCLHKWQRTLLEPELGNIFSQNIRAQQ